MAFLETNPESKRRTWTLDPKRRGVVRPLLFPFLLLQLLPFLCLLLASHGLLRRLRRHGNISTQGSNNAGSAPRSISCSKPLYPSVAAPTFGLILMWSALVTLKKGPKVHISQRSLSRYLNLTTLVLLGRGRSLHSALRSCGGNANGLVGGGEALAVA
ncbi:hypothetical protein EDB92DRAFT_660439 [Lactarius akahatsu]|uniref:Uncharacterized protein n=1 Tax=Lactarius akahatsu TaxID=416441 RepID=A0AAD4LFE9_9AGAM|nr:hypothetical protein EDB92DRAFT_660439 [Lactarius akahatsu]